MRNAAATSGMQRGRRREVRLLSRVLGGDRPPRTIMRHRNRTIYDAEYADITRDGTQIRIVRRHKPDSPLETVHSVETLDVKQARDLRDSLTEAIDRA